MMERRLSINDEETVMMRTARHARRRMTLTAAVVVVLTSLFSVVPAASAADSSDSDGVLQTLEAVPGGNLLDKVAPVAPNVSTDKVLTVDTSVTDTVVSNEPGVPIHLTSQQNKEVDLLLPYPETSAAATPVSDGMVAFANDQGFTTVPIVKEDGSVQVAIMLESADAPERYPFQVGLPEGASASVTDGGGVVFTSVDGVFLGGLAAPWAKDANGTALPTRYEVEKSSTGGVVVTQVIEHRSGDAVYPVVADPWLGIDLFAEAEYNREGLKGGQIVLSVMLSAWGWALYGYPNLGVPILIEDGWSEVVDKLPRATEKPTIRQQYYCHVYFGYNVFGAGVHWDFEMYRPNNSRWYAVWEHRCNWE